MSQFPRSRSNSDGSWGVSSRRSRASVRPAARRHGYEAEVQRHQTIAEAVGRHYPGWRKGSSGWGQDSVLQRICKDLDGSGVGVPETWRSGKTASLNGIRVRDWSEALDLGYKKLVRDAIRYALNWFVTRGPAKT